MIKDSHSVSLFGPLTLEFNLKMKAPPTLVADRHFVKSRGIHYGGSMLKIMRCLQNLGYSSNGYGYIGNDEYAKKISDIIKMENLNITVQKIPNMPTPISCNLYDNRSYSRLTTTLPDLTLWQLRIKQLILTNHVIFLDPAIPSKIQLEIIKQHQKNSTIVVMFPLDEQLDIFENSTNLVVFLTEVNAFKIFMQLGKTFFEEEKILKSGLFAPHNVIIESKRMLNMLDDTQEHTFISLDKISLTCDVLNEYFIAGFLCGILSKQSLQLSMIWGALTSIKTDQNQVFSRTNIINDGIKMLARKKL